MSGETCANGNVSSSVKFATVPKLLRWCHCISIKFKLGFIERNKADAVIPASAELYTRPSFGSCEAVKVSFTAETALPFTSFPLHPVNSDKHTGMHNSAVGSTIYAVYLCLQK